MGKQGLARMALTGGNSAMILSYYDARVMTVSVRAVGSQAGS